MTAAAGVLPGRIVRFHRVCNRFMKAFVDLGENYEGVYCLVALVDGVPVLEKNSKVAYVEGPVRDYKGHMVRGEIAAWEDLEDATLEDLEDAAEWGLR